MSNRVWLALSMLALMTASFALPVQQEDMEKDFKEAEKRFQQAETPGEQMEVASEFLRKYPESKYTKMILEATQYLCLRELHQPADFVELAEWVRGNVKDAGLARDVDFLLVGAYGATGDGVKLKALAPTLVAGGEVTFNTIYTIIQAACSTGEWEMVLDYSGRAERFASAEAYRKEFPDNSLTDKQLEQRGENRRGILLTYSGWAKENMGNRKDALTDFESADKLIDTHYLGYTDEKLNLFWGRTLLNSGKSQEAIDKLAPGAVFSGNAEMKSALKEAYDAESDDAGDFDAFFEDLRKKIAHPVDDFTLPNYQGEKLAMSSLKGKVVLLAFWFPT